MSRSDGVLKAYWAKGLSGSSAPRPRSVRVVPMSWNRLSVKFQPLWQFEQPAVPVNKAKPRFAAGEIASSSPSTQASNGV